MALIEIAYVLIALGAMGSLLIEIYWRLYRPYQQKREVLKESIYEPLHQDIEHLITLAEQYDHTTPFPRWRDSKRKISSEIFEKLEELFEVKYERFVQLIVSAGLYTEGRIWYVVYGDGKRVTELVDEFEEIGVGSFGQNLYGCLKIPILKGEKISVNWLDENCHDFYERIQSCEHSNQLHRLIKRIKSIPEEDLFKILNKERQALLNCAKALKLEFERRYI